MATCLSLGTAACPLLEILHTITCAQTGITYREEKTVSKQQQTPGHIRHVTD